MAANRTPKRTPKKRPWQELFLEELSARGSVVHACEAADCSRTNAYAERERSAEFARLWDEAKKISVERMEAEARRRAVEGTLKPVFQGGSKVGVVREYSDTLLIFLLKAHDPKYRDKQTIEHTGGTVVTHVYMPPNGRDDLAADATVLTNTETG